jgi:small subunit ribosomal protein S17
MRTKTGVVTSAKMQKTIVVTVDTYKTHPKYQKRYKASRKFYAHDEKGLAKEGDTVTISETRPLSATKRWILIEDSIKSGTN